MALHVRTAFGFAEVLYEQSVFGGSLDGSSMGTAWPAPRYRLGKGRLGDFHYIACGGIACSLEAGKLVREQVGDAVELLPLPALDAGCPELVVLNPLRRLACLDLEASEGVVLFPSNGRIARIREARFHEDLIRDEWLFRVERAPSALFCTERFRAWYEAAGLTGLRFGRFRR